MASNLPPLCREWDKKFLALSHDTPRSLSPDTPQARSRLPDLTQVLILVLYLSLRAESNGRRGGETYTQAHRLDLPRHNTCY